MDWITHNWQSPAAGTIVALTAAVFAVRLLRRRKNGGKPPCGMICECPRRGVREKRSNPEARPSHE